MAGVAWTGLHGRYCMAGVIRCCIDGVALPVLHGRCCMAGIAWQVLYGRYNNAGVVWQLSSPCRLPVLSP